MHRKLIFELIALALLPGSQVLQAAILTNPGFESGVLSPWYSNSGAVLVTNAAAHTGTFSASAFGNDEVRQDFTAVPVSSIIEVSFWAKRDGGPFDKVEFFYSDSTKSFELIDGTALGNGWIFFNVTSSLTPGKSLTGIGVFGTTSGPAYLDDFTITAQDSAAVPEPASLTLWTLGALGCAFAGYRRRKVA